MLNVKEKYVVMFDTFLMFCTALSNASLPFSPNSFDLVDKMQKIVVSKQHDGCQVTVTKVLRPKYVCVCKRETSEIKRWNLVSFLR